MTTLEQAVSRFDKLLEAPAYQDLAWANELQSQLAAKGLVSAGRPVCPVLRPHFISKRQYEQAVKIAGTFYNALRRLEEMALKNPTVMARLETLPAEKMLAQVDPGYDGLTAASFASLTIGESHIYAMGHSNEPPTETLLTDELTALMWESRPMKELRKKHKFAKPVSGTKLLVQSIFAAYKGRTKRGSSRNGNNGTSTNGSNGNGNGTLKKFPRVAIVEASQGLRSAASPESVRLAEHLRQLGFPTEVVPPEQLEYRNGHLCRGDFGIEIVYRRISAQELLVRFDLNHPLLRAYREGSVRMINGFRADLLSKPAVLTLLSDEAIIGQFPAAERKLLAAHVPWTRMVTGGKTALANGKQVELLEYILQHRESLVLRPNDTTTDAQTYRGAETEAATWDRALRLALRTPYVVQEAVPESRAAFPVLQLGKIELREMRATTQMHLYGGTVQTATADVSDATSAFSMLSGPVPVFVL